MNFNRVLKKLKTKYYSQRVARSCGGFLSRPVVNGSSKIGGNVYLGSNTNFNGIHIFDGGQVRIGNNFHSGTNCMIITKYHNYEGDMIPYDNTYIYKDVEIEDNVWIGNNVIILGGVTIGEGAIIQAGAVVVKSIPPLGIAGGNPATVYKYREKGRYFALKEAGKFH